MFQISLPFEAKDSEQREADLLRLTKDLILELMDCGGVYAKQMPMEMSSEYPELCQYFPSKRHIEYLSDRILSSELREKSDTLQRLFDEFNRKFFFGRLPIYQVRVVFDVRRFSGERDARDTIYGLIQFESRTIWIQACLDEMFMIRTLIHEMCHAATTGEHDEKFVAEMRRVRALGAPVHQGELDD